MIMASAYGEYGHQYTAPDAPVERRNGLGVAALVLGLAGLALFWTVVGGIVLGLLALLLGILGYRRKKHGLATNGAMAIIGAVAGILAVISSAIVLAVGASFLNSSEFKSYTDCIEHANTEAERNQCSKDFEKDVNKKS
jgi:multisubunit Na+/H+ antiporter MnhB subunit